MVRKVLKDTTDKKLYDERLYVAMQPARKRILLSLSKSESYASKLADELSLNAKVVQFHLDILQKYNLVKGNFDLESPSDGRPVAVRRFKLTDVGHDMLDVVRNIPSGP
jgi:predicted ArsR family transcriptional regulator